MKFEIKDIKKEDCVIVMVPDKNGKKHLCVCESMEIAKQLFPSDYEKRQATFYKKA